MKRFTKKIFMLTCLVSMLITQSCNDFLTIQLKDKFTEDNYFSSEANLKLYAWQFYELFLGYGNGSSTSSEFYFQTSPSTGCIRISDDLANASYLNYNATPTTTSTEWTVNYNYIRSINVMLENLSSVPLDAASAKHWEGVARFFRAFAYFQLVQRYGDVPYFDYVPTANDPSKIYLPRTPRATVMAKILEDLNFAATNLRENDGPNAINKYSALALITRVGLFEGTFVKYHKLNGENATTFLTAAKTAADAIIASNKYTLGTDFKAQYNSLDLGTNKEIILYKKYITSTFANSIQAYTNTSSTINGMTKFAVESYACADGLSISQSAQYAGDNSLTNVLTNRDKRLLAVIDSRAYGYADKTLNGLNSSTGYILNIYNNWSPPVTPGTDVTTIGQNQIDAPVFTYAEVLLNYVEACAELGSCTQADLDKSINLIRQKHAGIPILSIQGADVAVNGTVLNDPKRTAALEQISGVVTPLIWEIRRDRRAEFMTWTDIRYYDLMRWHKGEYLDITSNPDVALGAKLVGETLTNTKVNANGYITPYTSASMRSFVSPKYYLNSIPVSEITLYKAEGVELTQNPGWGI